MLCFDKGHGIWCNTALGDKRKDMANIVDMVAVK
jgi:hypothetical protein